MKNEKADKNRHTIWLTDEAWNAVSRHYREDNCSAHNEYIEKAIRFYSGYLDTQNASAYLPRVLSDILEGKLGALGSRIGSHVDSKLMQRIREKKIAAGHKPDDHEEQGYIGPAM